MFSRGILLFSGDLCLIGMFFAKTLAKSELMCYN